MGSVTKEALESRLKEVLAAKTQAENQWHTLNGAQQEVERILAEIEKPEPPADEQSQ